MIIQQDVLSLHIRADHRFEVVLSLALRLSRRDLMMSFRIHTRPSTAGWRKGRRLHSRRPWTFRRRASLRGFGCFRGFPLLLLEPSSRNSLFPDSEREARAMIVGFSSPEDACLCEPAVRGIRWELCLEAHARSSPYSTAVLSDYSLSPSPVYNCIAGMSVETVILIPASSMKYKAHCDMGIPLASQTHLSNLLNLRCT